MVNGKPALDWVVERQRVKEDPDSRIVNDANDWAIETMNNPRYPLELFQRVVSVGLETQLPKRRQIIDDGLTSPHLLTRKLRPSGRIIIAD